MDPRSLPIAAAALLCVSVATASTAWSQVQDKDQQKCINALNKAGSKVAAAQSKENQTCLKNGAKGKEPDAQACLTADAKLKVAKAQGKTASTDSKQCVASPPDFGRASVGQINGAARNEEVALTAAIFGADLTAAVIEKATDKVGAGCQQQVQKAYEKLAATKLKSFLKCKKVGLKDGTISSAAALEACFDTVAADEKVAKTAAKIADVVTKKCAGVTLATAFPGDCAGAGDFPACVDERVECHVCLTLDAMDDLGRDCDLFDDGLANGSCANLPPTPTPSPTATPTPTLTASSTPMLTGTPTPSATATPAPDWGLDCFATMDCGTGHCPSFGGQCTDYIESVGLAPGSEMCFFDCMDMSLMDVTDCRDSCGGSAPPPCETGTAGGGGFTGVVTGPGKCTPSGFAATVSFGGTASLLKRLLVDFGTPIDEATLFAAPPPPCPGSCPSPGSDCDAGAPYPAAPLADVFRLQVGAASPAPEVCDRLGVATTVCKFSATGYAFIVTPPGFDTSAPIDVSLFISCHVESSGGGTFLHFSTGDYFAVGSWPP